MATVKCASANVNAHGLNTHIVWNGNMNEGALSL